MRDPILVMIKIHWTGNCSAAIWKSVYGPRQHSYSVIIWIYVSVSSRVLYLNFDAVVIGIPPVTSSGAFSICHSEIIKNLAFSFWHGSCGPILQVFLCWGCSVICWLPYFLQNLFVRCSINLYKFIWS